MGPTLQTANMAEKLLKKSLQVTVRKIQNKKSSLRPHIKKDDKLLVIWLFLMLLILNKILLKTLYNSLFSILFQSEYFALATAYSVLRWQHLFLLALIERSAVFWNGLMSFLFKLADVSKLLVRDRTLFLDRCFRIIWWLDECDKGTRKAAETESLRTHIFDICPQWKTYIITKFIEL